MKMHLRIICFSPESYQVKKDSGIFHFAKERMEGELV